MNVRRFSLIIFFILLIVLSYFMLTPTPPKIAEGFRFIDKLEHFGAFFMLAVLLCIGTSRGRPEKRRGLIFSAAMLVIYGALMEVLQQYTGRSAEFSDLIADLAGTVAGCLVSLFFL